MNAAACAAIALFLPACDGSHYSVVTLDATAARQLVAAQVDPDRALADKVKHALAVDTEPGAYGVEVTASDGAVDLWGTVDGSAARKRLATTAAGVVGVRALRDHLRIDPGA
jgi:osmotically-inducible protein OsmY